MNGRKNTVKNTLNKENSKDKTAELARSRLSSTVYKLLKIRNL